MHYPNEKTVAIIGAGPAGLVSARWLAQHGFEPIVFEASERLGGQWNPAAEASGTWAGMRTNTSRVMSAFSDLDHESDVATYPRQDQMLAYLERYADRFGLVRRIQFGKRIELLEAAPDGRWRIRSRTGEGGGGDVQPHRRGHGSPGPSACTGDTRGGKLYRRAWYLAYIAI